MKNFYVLLTAGQAQLYNPHRQRWYLLFSQGSEGKALREAKLSLEELAREDLVSEAFGSLINSFTEKGFNLREILSGLAELSFRENYPDEVCILLEKASEAVPSSAVCMNPTLDLIRTRLLDDLITAQQFLQSAYDAAVKANLKDTHSELNGAIADALNSCSEAVQHVNDAPDV